MEFGEDFLTRPELFPARRAGERWGERGVELAFAGGPYLVTGVDREQERALRERFSGWLRSGTLTPRPPLPEGEGEEAEETERAAAEIRVFRAPGEEFREPGPAWREYRLDLDYQRVAVRVAGFHLMAVVELAPPVSAALWTSQGGAAFAAVAENVLRLAAAYRLLASGRALLHSAALVHGGEAVLFPGRSGAGKSTLSRLGLAAGWDVLSDELNVLALTGEGLAVHQVPFTGDLEPERTAAPRRSGYPLRSVCLLEQADADALTPASRGRAFAGLLSTAPFVNRDPHRGEELALLLEEAVRRRPASIFGFSRASRLEVLSELLQESPPSRVAREDAA
jgi:hypothetical protein